MHVRWGLLLLGAVCGNAFAWGDDGHQIVALVAAHYFEPGVRARIDALLKSDKTNLTKTDLAHEATWADKYRDSDRNTTQIRYQRTRRWHFVDTSIATGDLDAACFGHPALTAGTPALRGPKAACAVDKVDQFATELARSIRLSQSGAPRCSFCSTWSAISINRCTQATTRTRAATPNSCPQKTSPQARSTTTGTPKSCGDLVEMPMRSPRC